MTASATDSQTPPSPPPADGEERGDLGGLVGGLVLVGLLGLLALVSIPMLVVVLVIAFVITMHELGHYLTARWTGMKATEFFLGFGPRIWSFRRGETEFGVKPIFAGAYVKIVGMHSLEDVDPDDESRAYRQKSYPRRVLVASAGSIMHFAMAIIAMAVAFSFVGDREAIRDDWWVADIAEEGAAASAGIGEGDRIVAVDGVQTTDWAALVSTVEARPDETVEVTFLREGEDVATTAVVTLSSVLVDGERVGRIGVAADFEEIVHRDGVLTGVGRAFGEFPGLVGDSLGGLWAIFSNTPELLDRVISPPNDPTANENLETRPVSLIGVVQIGSDDAFDVWDQLWLFVAFNMFIGVFNLLPLLPLDGGHIAIATYERIREGWRPRTRYMVDIARLMPMTYAVVIFLIFFGFGTMWLDIANPIEIPG